MPCSDAERQQDFVRRLGLGAAVGRRVGISAVEELDEDDLERDALGLEARQAANPFDQFHLLLEEAESQLAASGVSAPSPWEEILNYLEVRHWALISRDEGLKRAHGNNFGLV
jgi:hypothetical protein